MKFKGFDNVDEFKDDYPFLRHVGDVEFASFVNYWADEGDVEAVNEIFETTLRSALRMAPHLSYEDALHIIVNAFGGCFMRHLDGWDEQD